MNRSAHINHPLHLEFAQTLLLLKIHAGIEAYLQTLMERIINKIKNLSTITDNFILVTEDAVVLYPSIPHEAGLQTLRETLDKQNEEGISIEDLVKMAEFVLKNNYSEFNSKIKQNISGTAIGSKFAQPYACLFINKLETSFLETQRLQPLV